MRLAGLGTNLAAFLDLDMFSSHFEKLSEKDSPEATIAAKLQDTFSCMAQSLDGSSEKNVFSILGQ